MNKKVIKKAPFDKLSTKQRLDFLIKFGYSIKGIAEAKITYNQPIEVNKEGKMFDTWNSDVLKIALELDPSERFYSKLLSVGYPISRKRKDKEIFDRSNFIKLTQNRLDLLENFDRLLEQKENARKQIITSLLAGLLVSVISGLIVYYFTK